MTLATFFDNGGGIWDTEKYSDYPDCLTAEIMADVSDSLDLDYSARNISKRIERRAENDGETLEARIIAHVHALAKRKTYEWDKLFGTLSLEYNPIENYSMIETENVNFSKGVQSNSEALGATNRTDTNGAQSGTQTESISAFNSAGYNPDRQTETTTQAVTNTSATQAVSNSFTDGAREDETARELTRSGNIGVTTSQQMIQSERELAVFSFVKIICDAIVNEICVNIF